MTTPTLLRIRWRVEWLAPGDYFPGGRPGWIPLVDRTGHANYASKAEARESYTKARRDLGRVRLTRVVTEIVEEDR